MTVDVVLLRTAAIELYILEALGHIHHHSVAEHVGHLGLFRVGKHLHCLAHVELTLAVECVGDGHCGVYLGHIIHGGDNPTARFLLFVERGQFHFGSEPGAEFLLHACAKVIVGRSTPEVRLD